MTSKDYQVNPAVSSLLGRKSGPVPVADDYHERNTARAEMHKHIVEQLMNVKDPWEYTRFGQKRALLLKEEAKDEAA